MYSIPSFPLFGKLPELIYKVDHFTFLSDFIQVEKISYVVFYSVYEFTSANGNL